MNFDRQRGRGAGGLTYPPARICILCGAVCGVVAGSIQHKRHAVKSINDIPSCQNCFVAGLCDGLGAELLHWHHCFRKFRWLFYSFFRVPGSPPPSSVDVAYQDSV